jgi:leader peptidase (prepilin peptidase)/N-methyltransferase
MTIVRPRSRCTRCLEFIRWYDNIPVASYLLLGGRCRFCRAAISPRYPLVELLTAVLFFFSAYQSLVGRPPSGDEFDAVVTMAARWFILAMIVTASFIDMDFRILPDEITKPGLVLSLAAVTAFPHLHDANPILARIPGHLGGLVSACTGALAGGGIIVVVRRLGKLIFRKEAMGEGDIFYLAFLGAYLGYQGAGITFILACLYGSVIGIFWLLLRKDHYIPFGPFLSLGALTMMFFSPHVHAAIRWYQGLLRGGGGGGG